MRADVSRPFPNAKIVRNSDMANFFEQKMSLFPLLKKRSSLLAYGECVNCATKNVFLVDEFGIKNDCEACS
jgi:hypothetical protein